MLAADKHSVAAFSDADYLRSARCLSGFQPSVEACRNWIVQRQSSIKSKISTIAFDQLERWHTDEQGNIVHESGQFFSIRGLRIGNHSGISTGWDQPVILQNEIGILGFLAKKIDDVIHFLVQAKIEPGNINLVQLSPTLQATYSNFSKVHGGRSPRYLDYFCDQESAGCRFDQFQSEQGMRFLDKRNRNVILEIARDRPVEAHEDYCWMTLGQLKALSRYDNLVNMDSRSVLSGIHLADVSPLESKETSSLGHGFGDSVLRSMSNQAVSEHGDREVLSWITRARFKNQHQSRAIDLDAVIGWHREEGRIASPSHNFSVIGVDVQIENREVVSWTQPMMQQQEPELFGFIVQRKKGTLHFLAHLQPEAGLSNKGEVGPTVQCCPEKQLVGEVASSREYLDLFLNAQPDQIRVDSLQSEEGGRFYLEQNRNMIVELDPSASLDPGESFCWMTLNQLLQLGSYANHLNIQTRSLLSLLDVNFDMAKQVVQETP